MGPIKSVLFIHTSACLPVCDTHTRWIFLILHETILPYILKSGKAWFWTIVLVVSVFSYENHCDYYKKLTSKLCLVLFKLTSFFFYLHSPLLLGNKKMVLSLLFPHQIRPLFNYKHHTILTWGLVSIWITNTM